MQNFVRFRSCNLLISSKRKRGNNRIMFLIDGADEFGFFRTVRLPIDPRTSNFWSLRWISLPTSAVLISARFVSNRAGRKGGVGGGWRRRKEIATKLQIRFAVTQSELLIVNGLSERSIINFLWTFRKIQSIKASRIVINWIGYDRQFQRA